MVVDNFEFIEQGTEPKKRRTQYKIIKILKANEDLAFSMSDLQEIIGVRRQGIVQAIKALENRGEVIVGMIHEDNHLVMYTTIKEEKNGKRKKELERTTLQGQTKEGENETDEATGILDKRDSGSNGDISH